MCCQPTGLYPHQSDLDLRIYPEADLAGRAAPSMKATVNVVLHELTSLVSVGSREPRPNARRRAPPPFMHIVGGIEIIAGLLVLSRFTRYAAYVVMAWLLAIAASLIAQALFLDIAVRDIELSLGAFVLARLTEVRELTVFESGHGSEHPIPDTERVRHLA